MIPDALRVARFTGRELQELLSPFPPEAFASEHWDRRPLFVKGDPGKIPRLLGTPFDRATFEAAAAELLASEDKIQASFRSKRFTGHVFRAYFDHGSYLATGEGTRPLGPIRLEQAGDALARGASLQILGVEHIPRIGALAEALRAQLHYPGAVIVGSILTPRGQRIFPHFDPGGALILQAQGKKRYSFTPEPLVELPQGKAHLFSDGSFRYTQAGGGEQQWETPPPFDGRYESVVMDPGDLLYVAPGVVHHTETVEGESLALLFTFIPVSFRLLLGRLLERHLGSDPRWRQLPVWTGTGGRLPEPVEAFAKERLREARELLSSLEAGGLELNELWCEMSASSDVWPAAPPAGPVAPGERLRRAEDAPIVRASGRDREGQAGLVLFRGRSEVRAPGEWAAFLERLLSVEEFVAGDVMSWQPPGDWDEVSACLESLLDQGILSRVGA